MILKNSISAALLAAFAATGTSAQTPSAQALPEAREKEAPGAWEIGLGGSLINYNRVSLTGFTKTDAGYNYTLDVAHLMGGANLYIARELNPWLYLDLQGTVGMARDKAYSEIAGKEWQMLYMGGLGLQLRLSPLFKSNYVEPYLRVGANYLYKDFPTTYMGGFRGDETGEAAWQSSDVWNPAGRTDDRSSFFPLSFGAGVNAWLNDRIGIGLQGEYLMPVRQNLPHFAQVSLRVMWRIGGRTKKPAPRVEYVEVTVDRPVEVEKIVEKVVEKEVIISDLFGNIYFDFDQDVLTPTAVETIAKISDFLKAHPDERYAVVGFTDIRGSEAYNKDLSWRRAKRVYDALIESGVSSKNLRYRNAGKGSALVPYEGPEETREGDRKVILEKVNNDAYWAEMPGGNEGEE